MIEPDHTVPVDTNSVVAQADRHSRTGDGAPDRAVRNTVSLLTSRIAIAAMGWAGTVIIARMLSPEDWGKFSFVFGVLGMMSIVTDLGVGRVVLARLVGDDALEVTRVASAFVALRAALGLFGYAVAVGFVYASGYPADVVAATALGGLVVVVATPSHALTVLYQSRLRLSYVAASEMLAQLLQLAFTVAAALFAPVLLVFVLPAVANEIVSIVLKIRGVVKGHAGPPPAGRPEVWRWKEMLLEAVPLSIGFAFVEASSKVDVLMLGRLDTFESVGLYSIGYKFSDFVLVAALAVITPFTTLLVSAWPHDPVAFRDAARRAGTIIAILCAAGIAAFWPVTEPLLTLLYGDRFAAATLSTKLLVAGGVMAALSQLALMVLVAAGRNKIYPWVALLALLANVGLNFVLIPRFSFTGAAWATIASQATMLVLIAIVVRVTIGIPRLLPILPVAVSMGVAAILITISTNVPVVRELPWPILATVNGLLTLLIVHLLGLTGGLSVRSLVRRRRRRSMRERQETTGSVSQ